MSNAADPPWSARAGVAVKGPIANWSDLGVSKNGHCELVSLGVSKRRPLNWSVLGVSKPLHVSKTPPSARPTPPRAPVNWSDCPPPTGEI